jgi:dihydroorotate dehydrogenase (NAD+) catalytic subunit
MRRPRLGAITGGLSGPAIRPVAVRMVWEVTRAVPLPVIGVGGIATASDALEFMIAGASAVAIATALITDPTAVASICAGLEEYARRHGLAAVADVVGTLQP